MVVKRYEKDKKKKRKKERRRNKGRKENKKRKSILREKRKKEKNIHEGKRNSKGTLTSEGFPFIIQNSRKETHVGNNDKTLQLLYANHNVLRVNRECDDQRD